VSSRSTAESTSVSEKPSIRGADDWLAMATRLRVLMEDPRQLLSGAVTGLRYSPADRPPPTIAVAVTVPGLDGEPYPDPG